MSGDATGVATGAATTRSSARASAAATAAARAGVTVWMRAGRSAADLTAVALLLTVAIVGFGPSFDGPQYLVAGFGALVLGLAIAWIGARRRWGVLVMAGATVVAYFLFGGALALPHTALAGVVPTLDTWGRLALGTVTSFKQLLTTVPPVSASDGHLIVPFLLTLVAAVLTGSLALRVRPVAWSLLPAGALLGVQILLGVAQPAAPILQGIVFAVVTAVWLALRQAWDPLRAAVRVEPSSTSDAAAVQHSRVRRLVAAGVVLAVAGGAGVVTGALASPPTPRFVLRDFVVPPFDIRQYPSPLQSFRAFVRDDAQTPLFTVTGLPEDGRIRLATMDDYDGVVYNVSGEGAGASSAFTSVRSNMSPEVKGAASTLRVEISGLSGVWMPDAGAVRDIEFDGDRADALRRAAYYNDATGTAVVTAALTEGDAYTLTSVFPDVPSDAALADVAFAPVKMPPQGGIPDALADLASKAVAEAETPIDQARALQAWLSTDGFFSHGLTGDVLSPSGHGAARITSLFGGDQMIGDDEQYAVAMSLLATQLGIPARVVMGWHPEEDEDTGSVFTATGDNLHAWVEIAFECYGWVPFDPTPDEDQEPNDQTTTPRANPKPQVLQPPPPAQEPADLPPVLANDREQEDEEPTGFEWLGTVLLYGALTLGILALLAAPFLVIGALKARRRARRLGAERASDRISGGWDELVDNARDLRVPVEPGATRAESAVVVGETLEQPRVVALAERADAEVYGPGEPSADDVAAFWNEVDDIVGGMNGSTSRWGRLRGRLSLRSLRATRRGTTP